MAKEIHMPDYNIGQLEFVKIISHGVPKFRIGDFVFTIRQLEILRLKGQGLTGREAAERLGISHLTLNNTLVLLKENNVASPEIDPIPSTYNIVKKAEILGLLNPMVFIALNNL